MGIHRAFASPAKPFSACPLRRFSYRASVPAKSIQRAWAPPIHPVRAGPMIAVAAASAPRDPMGLFAPASATTIVLPRHPPQLITVSPESCFSRAVLHPPASALTAAARDGLAGFIPPPSRALSAPLRIYKTGACSVLPRSISPLYACLEHARATASGAQESHRGRRQAPAGPCLAGRSTIFGHISAWKRQNSIQITFAVAVGRHR